MRPSFQAGFIHTFSTPVENQIKKLIKNKNAVSSISCAQTNKFSKYGIFFLTSLRNLLYFLNTVVFHNVALVKGNSPLRGKFDAQE
jgi:hypothetical protein